MSDGGLRDCYSAALPLLFQIEPLFCQGHPWSKRFAERQIIPSPVQSIGTKHGHGIQVGRKCRMEEGSLKCHKFLAQ